MHWSLASVPRAVARARARVESSHHVTTGAEMKLRVLDSGPFTDTKTCKVEHISFTMWNRCHGKARRGACTKWACLTVPESEPG